MIKLFLSCISLSMLGLFQIPVSAQNWKLIEKQAMPVKISNNAVTGLKVNGKFFVYSFAGIDSTKLYSGISNQSFKYDVQADRWDSIPPLPDQRTKIAAAASAVKGKIYIIGGYTVFSNGSEISSNKVHRFDPAADSFLTDGTPIPVPIDDQVQAVYKDSLIYVITGWSNTTNVNNVQIYNPSTNSWSQGTSVPFNSYRVFGASGTIIGDTIYYYGGASRFGNFPLTNYLRKGAINPSNPNQISWSTFIPDSGLFNYRNSCTEVSGRPVWFGGSAESYNFDGIAFNGSGGVSPSNRIIRLDSNNQLLVNSPDTGTLPMDLRGIASLSNGVKYLVGGMLSGQSVTNKTFRLEKQLLTGLKKEVRVGKELKFSFYPNPFGNHLQLNNQSRESLECKIFSASGLLQYSFKMKALSEKRIQTNLSEGIYFLKITNGKESVSKTLIHIKD